LQLVERLAFAEGSHWALAFYDGRSVVLADLGAESTRGLAENVVAGRARFRDARVAGLSRALCRLPFAAGVVEAQDLSDLVAANRMYPTAGGPWFLLFAAQARPSQSDWVVTTLEAEYRDFTAESGPTEDRLGRLQARLSTAQILTDLYRGGPRAAHWADTLEGLVQQLDELPCSP